MALTAISVGPQQMQAMFFKHLSILFKLRKVKLSREVMNAFGGLICITVVSSVFFPFHIGLSAMIALTLLANLQGALADAEVA